MHFKYQQLIRTRTDWEIKRKSGLWRSSHNCGQPLRMNTCFSLTFRCKTFESLAFVDRLLLYSGCCFPLWPFVLRLPPEPVSLYVAPPKQFASIGPKRCSASERFHLEAWKSSNCATTRRRSLRLVFANTHSLRSLNVTLRSTATRMHLLCLCTGRTCCVQTSENVWIDFGFPVHRDSTNASNPSRRRQCVKSVAYQKKQRKHIVIHVDRILWVTCFDRTSAVCAHDHDHHLQHRFGSFMLQHPCPLFALQNRPTRPTPRPTTARSPSTSTGRTRLWNRAPPILSNTFNSSAILIFVRPIRISNDWNTNHNHESLLIGQLKNWEKQKGESRTLWLHLKCFNENHVEN